MSRQRPTIDDVAKLAGVSRSLVSRVVADNGPVSAAARERVTVAMAHLGYRSNESARALRSGRHGNVGLLLRKVTSPFYSQLFMHLQTEANRDRLRIIGATGNMIEDGEQRALEDLLSVGIDGLIVGSGSMPTGDIAAIAARIPTVVLGRSGASAGASSVMANARRQADETVGLLAQAGHRQIAFVDNPGTASAQARALATRVAANERGLRLVTIDGGYDFADGHAAAQRLHRDLHEVTALLTLGHDAAIGAMHTLQDKGIAVPDDVSIVSSDVSLHDENPFTPQITGTGFDVADFAARAWAEVKRLIESPESARAEILIDVHTVTGCTLAQPSSRVNPRASSSTT